MMNICININQHSESTSYDEHLYQQINQHSESTSYDEHLYQQINQHPMMNICINQSYDEHLYPTS